MLNIPNSIIKVIEQYNNQKEHEEFIKRHLKLMSPNMSDEAVNKIINRDKINPGFANAIISSFRTPSLSIRFPPQNSKIQTGY